MRMRNTLTWISCCTRRFLFPFQAGYLEGIEAGKQQGLEEGFHHGFVRGLQHTIHWAVLRGKIRLDHQLLGIIDNCSRSILIVLYVQCFAGTLL